MLIQKSTFFFTLLVVGTASIVLFFLVQSLRSPLSSHSSLTVLAEAGLPTGQPFYLTASGVTQVNRQVTPERGVYYENFATSNALPALHDMAWDPAQHHLQLALRDNVSQSESTIVADADGYLYVVWTDNRNAQADIYAQRLNPQGQRLWQQDRRVNSDDGHAAQFAPAAAVDTEGNLWVVWSDQRAERNAIFAQCLSRNGDRCWLEDTPVSPANAPGDHDKAAIALTADQGALVIWHNNRTGDYNLYGQRINAEGALLWATDRRIDQDETGAAQTDPAVRTLTGGDAIITWRDRRDGQGRIYAQRITPTGLPAWTVDLPVSPLAEPVQTAPALALSHAGQIWIAWSSLDENLYLHLLDWTGAPQWQAPLRINTKPTNAGIGGTPALVALADGSVVVAWRHAVDGTIDGQRVDPTGRFLWGAALRIGKGTTATPCAFPTLATAAGYLFAGWQDHQRDGQGDIYALQLDAAGSAQWQEAVQVNAASGHVDQVAPMISVGADGRATIAWQDWRSGNPRLYAQRFSPDGMPLWSTTIWVNRTLDMVSDSAAGLATLVNGETVVVWSAQGPQDRYPRIYSVRLDAQGGLSWPPAQSLSTPDPQADLAQLNPVVAADRLGNFFVAWQEKSGEQSVIRVQRLQMDGRPLWPAAVSVTSQGGSQRYVQVAPIGESALALVWLEVNGLDADLYAQQLAADGSPVWTAPVRVNQFAGLVDLLALPAVAGNRQGAMAVAWVDRREAGVYLQQFNSAGGALWSADVRVDPGQTGLAPAPALMLDDTGQATVVWQQRYRDRLAVAAQRLDVTGAPLWSVGQTGFITVGLAAGSTTQGYPQMAADPTGALAVVWQDERRANPDLYWQRLDNNGQPLWPVDHPVVEKDAYYLQEGIATSTVVGTFTTPIGRALLTTVVEPDGGGSMHFALSNDGGVHWSPTMPGVMQVFTTTSSALRWRAQTAADPRRLQHTPRLRQITIEYAGAPDLGGDRYEPDDRCSDSWSVATDGTAQERALATTDVDWVKVAVQPAVTYLFHAQATEPAHNLALTLWEGCLPDLAPTMLVATGAGTLRFTAATTATLYLRITHAQDKPVAPTTYQLVGRAERTPGLAILVAGRQTASDATQRQIDEASILAYNILQAHGYTPEQIYYLSHQGERADSAAPHPAVDAAPSLATLAYAISDWVREQPPEQRHSLLLYLVGPGENDRLYLDADQAVQPALLDLWLSNLEATTALSDTTIIVESNQAGSWLERVTGTTFQSTLQPSLVLDNDALSAPQRVLVTATDPQGVALAGTHGLLFANTFWPAMDRGLSVRESWRRSRQSLLQAELVCNRGGSSACLTPWLDDDGDAQPDAVNAEGGLAAAIGLSGANLYPIPQIITATTTAVSNQLLLTETITVTVTASAFPLEVEARLVASTIPQVLPTNGLLPLLNARRIPLQPIKQLPTGDVYVGVYTKTLPSPSYQTLIYAWDQEGYPAAARIAAHPIGQQIYLPLIGR